MTTKAGSTITTSRKRASPPEPDDLSESVETSSAVGDSREELIATAAYYRAEQRGFVEGGELGDCLAAEEEIERCLVAGGKRRVGEGAVPCFSAAKQARS